MELSSRLSFVANMACFLILIVVITQLQLQKCDLEARQPASTWPQVSFNPIQASLTQESKLILVPTSCKFDATGFSEVYTSGFWAKDDWQPGAPNGTELLKPSYYYSYSEEQRSPFRRASLSGSGSKVGYATRASLRFYTDLIHRYNIRTMIDVPCGDANWQFQAWELDSLDAYIGLDVAVPAIRLNQERFKFHRNKVFEPWDMTQCGLPRLVRNGAPDGEAVDLVHFRDAIQHMPIALARKAVCNVAKSGAKYVIITTFPDTEVNQEAKWWPPFSKYNLLRPPFSFPAPLNCVKTHNDLEKDETCVWSNTKMSLTAACTYS